MIKHLITEDNIINPLKSQSFINLIIYNLGLGIIMNVIIDALIIIVFDFVVILVYKQKHTCFFCNSYLDQSFCDQQLHVC